MDVEGLGFRREREVGRRCRLSYVDKHFAQYFRLVLADRCWRMAVFGVVVSIVGVRRLEKK